MTLDELVEHTRKHVLRDSAVPPLWSDEELTLYLNEAQDQFARRTHQLSDAESDFTFVELEAGVALYQLDPRIVFVAEAFHADGTPLRDRSRGQVRRTGLTGRPMIYMMDASMRSMRVFPTPDQAYTLDLTVARKPLAKLVNGTDEPEIDEDYHLDLCNWAAFRAARNNDVDGMAGPDAGGFRNDWEMRVRDAKRDVYRYRAGANPAARSNWTGKR